MKEPLIDYLLRFDDEAMARKLCPDMLTATPEDGGEAPWNGSFIIPGVRAYIPGQPEADPPVPDYDVPGWYLWCATQGRQANLEGESWCLLGAERDTGLIVHSRLSIEALSATHISPVMCGSAYRFGVQKVVGVDVAPDAIV